MDLLIWRILFLGLSVPSLRSLISRWDGQHEYELNMLSTTEIYKTSTKTQHTNQHLYSFCYARKGFLESVTTSRWPWNSAQRYARRRNNNVDQLKVWPITYEHDYAISGLHRHNSEPTKSSCWIFRRRQLWSCTHTTATPPKRPAGFSNYINLRLEPTQQQRH